MFDMLLFEALLPCCLFLCFSLALSEWEHVVHARFEERWMVFDLKNADGNFNISQAPPGASFVYKMIGICRPIFQLHYLL